MVIHKPPVVYFLKQAAGIQRGAMETGCTNICFLIMFYNLYFRKGNSWKGDFETCIRNSKN